MDPRRVTPAQTEQFHEVQLGRRGQNRILTLRLYGLCLKKKLLSLQNLIKLLRKPPEVRGRSTSSSSIGVSSSLFLSDFLDHRLSKGL